MPILAAEPNLHPFELFDTGKGAFAGHAWHVLHTRPRQEKSLARQLLKLQVPFYLPLVVQRNQIRGRVVESQLPLFGGYLFLLSQPEQRIAALATNRVVSSLPVPNQDQLWDELGQVHRLIRSGLPVRPEDKLEPGAPRGDPQWAAGRSARRHPQGRLQPPLRRPGRFHPARRLGAAG